MIKVYSIDTKRDYLFSTEITTISKNRYLGDFVLSGNNCELEKIISQYVSTKSI